MLGLCTSPGFNPTLPHKEELNIPWIRSIILHMADLDNLIATNLPFVLTLNNQFSLVRGDWSGWDAAVHTILEHLKTRNKLQQLMLLSCGNELDLYWAENGSVPPEFGADITRRAKRLATNYNIKVSATSLAGPRWPEYFDIMSNLLGNNDVDFYDIHPYGQRPTYWKNKPWMHGELSDVLLHMQSKGKPVIATEYGVKIRDAGSEQEVANFLRAVNQEMEEWGVLCSWFAYCDEVGAPSERGPQAFGLLSDNNVKRPAWYAFAEVNTVSPQDIYAEWGRKVGKGLLDMMVVDRTEPAMASEWRPFDRPTGTPATIEMCFGLNNVQYFWNLNTSSGWRVRPT